MATPISDLPEPDSYDASNSWLLIEQDSTLYKMQASSFLNASTIQSQYIDSIYTTFGLQPSSLTFSRAHLLGINSSFIITLDFGNKSKLPSTSIIKNSGSDICKILTFEGVTEFNVNDAALTLNLSSLTLQNSNQTNIVCTLSCVKGLTDSIQINNLKLENVSNVGSLGSAYCCAKIEAQVINN